MLAAIIANLQNVVPGPSPRPPTVHVDRGGGGALWPRVDIVDIVAAIATFPEIAGEHPVARAARRQRHIGNVLPGIKESREKREAAAFLAGATLADAAAEERHAAIAELKIEQLVEIVDAVRGTPPPPPPAALPESVVAAAPDRGAWTGDGDSAALGIALFAGGIALGLLLARKKRPRARGGASLGSRAGGAARGLRAGGGLALLRSRS